jgi:hypothetical protein
MAMMRLRNEVCLGEKLTVGNEPEWVLEYERQERRIATEVRKKEMEERISRVRERERREKLAAKKSGGRAVKRRVFHSVD